MQSGSELRMRGRAGGSGDEHVELLFESDHHKQDEEGERQSGLGVVERRFCSGFEEFQEVQGADLQM